MSTTRRVKTSWILTAFMLGAIVYLGITGVRASQSRTKMIERGSYLVKITVCNDCHTPFHMTERGPEPDMSRMLSGHPEDMELPPPPHPDVPWGMVGAMTNTAWAGPWGVSYTANLTPDSLTGLGIWTEDMFIRAMREGKHMGTSRPIQPPMPWPWYSQMTDQDLKAVFAYLQSIPPIYNNVPAYEPPPDPDPAS